MPKAKYKSQANLNKLKASSNLPKNYIVQQEAIHKLDTYKLCKEDKLEKKMIQTIFTIDEECSYMDKSVISFIPDKKSNLDDPECSRVICNNDLNNSLLNNSLQKNIHFKGSFSKNS